MHLTYWDWLIIGVYGAVVITIGLRAGFERVVELQ